MLHKKTKKKRIKREREREREREKRKWKIWKSYKRKSKKFKKGKKLQEKRLEEKSLWREKNDRRKRQTAYAIETFDHLSVMPHWDSRVTMKFHFLSHYLHNFVFRKCNLKPLLHVSKCKWQKIWNFGIMWKPCLPTMLLSTLKFHQVLKYDMLSKLKKLVFYMAR